MIRIDRSTIRANPDRQPCRWMTGRSITTQVREYSEPHGVWHRETWVGHTMMGGKLIDGVMTQQHMWTGSHDPNRWVTSTSVSYDGFALHDLSAAPAYLYDYEPATIVCRACKEEFPVGSLTTDSTYCEDEETCCDTVCPVCGAWECCDPPEYETLSDVDLERYATVNWAERRDDGEG